MGVSMEGPPSRWDCSTGSVPRPDDPSAARCAQAQSEWRWTRAYVENVAAAIVLAVLESRAAGRIYNVGDESALTERGWAEEIARAIDWPGNIVVVPAEEQPEDPREPFDFRYELMTDTTRIRNDLGFSDPLDREESLRRTIEWEQRQRAQQS